MKFSHQKPALKFLFGCIATLVLGYAATASAAIPEAEMGRLLKDVQLPFQYRCAAPLSRKFRIESHTEAAQLQKQINGWRECVSDYNNKIHAFVALEPSSHPAVLNEMSAEQKQQYRKAVAAAVNKEVAALTPRVEATRALLNETVDDYNSRTSGIGFTDAEFKKIEARFETYVYDCEAPDSTNVDRGGAYRTFFLSEGFKFLDCGSLWARRASEFRTGGRAAVVPDSEFDRMTPEQQERVDYLASRAYTMYLPLSAKLKEETESKHREIAERLMRLD